MAVEPAPAFGGTALVETPNMTTPVKQEPATNTEVSSKSKENHGAALKLSIN